VLTTAALIALTISPLRAEWGDAQISNWAGPWPIVIRTCWWDAGAICSLNWRDREFIDDYDHGRQLQSAVKFDDMFEAFNPTEAGAEYTVDGINPHASSSQLLGMWTTSNALATATRMAFWKPVNGSNISDHMLYKQVTIGLPGMAHVIEYLTQFDIPANESHSEAQFEVVTGYMPGSFSRCWTFDVRNGATDVVPLDPQGIQNLPVIFSTEDEGWAMGIYSPDYQSYGAFRFPEQNVVAWDLWVRIFNPSGSYSFRSYVIVGSLENVKVSMQQLYNAIG
jgi:hypothetical protein